MQCASDKEALYVPTYCTDRTTGLYVANRKGRVFFMAGEQDQNEKVGLHLLGFHI